MRGEEGGLRVPAAARHDGTMNEVKKREILMLPFGMPFKVPSAVLSALSLAGRKKIHRQNIKSLCDLSKSYQE